MVLSRIGHSAKIITSQCIVAYACDSSTKKRGLRLRDLWPVLATKDLVSKKKLNKVTNRYLVNQEVIFYTKVYEIIETEVGLGAPSLSG